MSENNFFEEQTASSRVKAGIVSEYFPSYCNIIVTKHKPKAIRYIDLFAGPGYYKDGNPSTPILIARKCKSNVFLRENVKMYFNDNEYATLLKNNFYKEFPSGTFTHEPYFADRTVGEEDRISDFLRKSTMNNGKNDFPSLLFIDPFGYKAIQTSILAQFLSFWGNEIFLFVNTKRIQPALENDKFEPLMKELFPTTLDQIRNNRKYKSSVAERLQLIIDSLGQEYYNILKNNVYYTAFKFKEEDSDATSHYILHFTKGERGYDLIKTIYNDFANVGTIFDGKNTYTFDAKKIDNKNEEFFDLDYDNINKLKEDLFIIYSNKIITAHDLFEENQPKTLYSRKHYTEALRRLVSEKRLIAKYTDSIKHEVSVLLSNNCILEFK
jgi:three-Cys-motif partner protein